MANDMISISVLAACKAGEHGSCYGWLATDAEQGVGIRCGCPHHLTDGWKFDGLKKLREARAELSLIFAQFTLPHELNQALRSVASLLADRDTYRKGEPSIQTFRRGKIIVHRKFEGEHIVLGDSCWCRPLAVEASDLREARTIIEEFEKCEG